MGDDERAACPRLTLRDAPCREQLTGAIDSQQDACADAESDTIARGVSEVEDRKNDVREGLDGHHDGSDQQQCSGRLLEWFLSVHRARLRKCDPTQQFAELHTLVKQLKP